MLQEIFRIPLPQFLQHWLHKAYIPVYGYGLMIVLGFLFGAQLMKYLARRHGFDGETFVNAALIALISGVIGARLSHVLENWSAFTRPDRTGWENFQAMLNVSSGGLTFYGGFLFATPILILYALWKRVPLLRGMDIVAPCLMVGLAFGRMGCFLNGCCHGDQCDLPWAVRFPYQSNAYVEHYEEDARAGFAGPAAINPPDVLRTGRLDRDGIPILKSKNEILDPEGTAKALRESKQFDEARRIEAQTPGERAAAKEAMRAQYSHPVHPAQLYSVVTAGLIACVLVAFLSMAPAPGRVFALMLVIEGASRFVLEMLRVEPRVWGTPLSYSMWLSMFLVVAGVGMWLGCGWLAGRRKSGLNSQAPARAR